MLPSILFRSCVRPLVLAVSLAVTIRALDAQNAPVAAPSARPAPGSSETIDQLTLRQESLDQVLALLERWTGRTVLRSQSLPTPSLTVSLPPGISKKEAILAIESLLNLNGVAVVEMGDKFLKAVPTGLARAESPKMIDGSTLDLPASSAVAAKVFSFSFMPVTEFLPLATNILNPAVGAPVVFERSNAILITDSISNLQRIERLQLELDHPKELAVEPRAYLIRYARATDLVTQLTSMLGGTLQAKIGPDTSFHADERTNQIMVIADPRRQEFIAKVIAMLDVQSDPSTRNVVIPLKHATAADVATLLTNLVTGTKQSTTSTTSTSRTTSNRQNGPAGQNAQGGPQAAQTATASSGSGTPTEEFSSRLTILADERSNSIVVYGTDDDLRLITDLVGKIDVLLPQVRIEVVIVEVSLTDANASGISALGLTVEGDKLTGFSGTSETVSVTDGTITRTSGNRDLAATIALSTTPRKSNSNILSMPTIVTTHNQEATIFVGESRPVISSYLNESATTGTSSGYSTTVSYTDIGIELTVLPLIGNDGSVQLDITQKVEDILSEVSIDGNDQPVIGSRTTESFVSAKSGEIIVLGGLQRATTSKSTSRLGPIPIIGDLLGGRSKEKTRTDLIFFLRPVVLGDSATEHQDALRQISINPQGQKIQEFIDKSLPPVTTPAPAAGTKKD